MSARAKVASRLHVIRKDLHRSRAQAGIVSEREAGNANKNATSQPHRRFFLPINSCE